MHNIHNMRELTDRQPRNYQGRCLFSGESGRIMYIHEIILSYVIVSTGFQGCESRIKILRSSYESVCYSVNARLKMSAVGSQIFRICVLVVHPVARHFHWLGCC